MIVRTRLRRLRDDLQMISFAKCCHITSNERCAIPDR